jgi:hypothetical protein
MSIYYDKKRDDVSFKIGDFVYIKLAKFGHSGYTLPNDASKKLSQQNVGPFRILQSVGRLAYKLDIPSTWKIHPVISVAHLERHHPDPYNRQLPPPPDIIHDTDDDSHEEWEVEEVLRSRLKGKDKNKRKEWRIKRKGFGSEHNTWEPNDKPPQRQPTATMAHCNEISLQRHSDECMVDAPRVILRRSIRNRFRGSSPTIGSDGQSCAHSGPGPQPCRKGKDTIGRRDEQARNLELVARDSFVFKGRLREHRGKTQTKTAYRGRACTAAEGGGEKARNAEKTRGAEAETTYRFRASAVREIFA